MKTGTSKKVTAHQLIHYIIQEGRGWGGGWNFVLKVVRYFYHFIVALNDLF